MGTDNNRQLLEHVNLANDASRQATPRDLIIAVRAESQSQADEAVQSIEASLRAGTAVGTRRGASRPASLHEAFDQEPDTNLVLVSVPGEYAAREAEIALEAGRHVMVFSDNVPLEDEVRLKTKAADRGLLMMGPDCGTSIINGIPLAFANVVRKGPIGIVAAAGTGLQEVSCLIHRYGSGVSQGIGTGGRDVKDSVGGLTFLPAMDALLEDPSTKVVLLVSKPTGATVLERVAERIQAADKPVVVAMLGGSREPIEAAGGVFAGDLAEGARLAVQAAGLTVDTASTTPLDRTVGEAASSISKGRRYLRALYTGGTLCYECLLLLSEDYAIESNVSLDSKDSMADVTRSQGHAAVDLGDDEFTRGRPHPMMEPSLRSERMVAELQDPETAILLLDFVLGYGSHDDPVGQCLDELVDARDKGVCVVASITGTEEDPQGYGEQMKKLQQAGVFVLDSNADAVRFAHHVLNSLETAGA
jgi:FdrA protein